MDSPIGPELGRSDLQVDVARIGTIWGPELNSGNARLRTAVAPNVVVEADGGVLHVTNAGSGPSRNAYTGRVGALWQSEDQRLALAAGVGGGTSRAAGNFAGADIGAMVSGKHRHIRPVFSADIGYSGPIGTPRTFSVEDDGSSTALQLPRNYVGKLNFGLELGPTDFSMLVGIGYAKFWLRESSRAFGDPDDTLEEDFVAIGIGFRARL